ncbi:DUF2798 domain-containing protein [Pseudoalteromonas sp. JBTF-M23]|uniref:DUF2798 domain-containing protein n=1 Tax=Pseudoalteromonas caenipelagi TaxID=2726988 RepID=A0A849VHV7_9GAMM|nr:DUF2798 domain-containing protein [Pseudoalteromonas caenipelagi]NOU51257.1 DUF2798 domain-containing protein [Pseudoalteromonas caenipelagi]
MQKLIFTLLLSLCLSFMVSGWVTYINLGLVTDFASRWTQAFCNAWPASFTAAYLLSSPISVITLRIKEKVYDKAQ